MAGSWASKVLMTLFILVPSIHMEHGGIEVVVEGSMVHLRHPLES